jgi:hypothetical protein
MGQGRSRARIRTHADNYEQSEAGEEMTMEDAIYWEEEGGGQTWERDQLFQQQLQAMFGQAFYASLQANLPGDIYIADVADSLDRFSFELNLAYQLDDRVPAIEWNLEYPIPVDSRGVLMNADLAMDSWLQLFSAVADSPGHQMRYSVERVLETMQLSTRYLSPGEAREAFMGNVHSFMRIRGEASASGATAMGQGAGVAQATGAGAGLLLVDVHTQGQGFRIHYSPVYLFNGRGTVLGSPTTPVSGQLRPGRYVFGGDKPGHPPTWDTVPHNIPPNQVHLTAI